VPYSAEIRRGNPTSFIFLLDQSRSMSERFGDHDQTKAEFVADVVNRTLHDLVIRATRADGVRDYYYISVIGYGRSIGPAFSGALSGKSHVPISEIAANPSRLELRLKKVPDGEGRTLEQQIRFPVWMNATFGGWTHMCAGLTVVRNLLDEWLRERANGFPPTVLHLTDGGSTDGDPTTIAADILSRNSTDGQVLLFNCHVTGRHATKIEYPVSGASLPDSRARILFNISSPLPDVFLRAASQFGLALPAGARGFVFNGDPVSVAQFFEIGTRPANLR
jgi:hypothetical protein